MGYHSNDARGSTITPRSVHRRIQPSRSRRSSARRARKSGSARSRSRGCSPPWPCGVWISRRNCCSSATRARPRRAVRAGDTGSSGRTTRDCSIGHGRCRSRLVARAVHGSRSGRTVHSRGRGGHRLARSHRRPDARVFRQRAAAVFRRPSAHRRRQRAVEIHDVDQRPARIPLHAKAARRARCLQPLRCGGQRHRLLLPVPPSRRAGMAAWTASIRIRRCRDRRGSCSESSSSGTCQAPCVSASGRV